MCRTWQASWWRAGWTVSRKECVAGLVDGGGDVGAVDRTGRGDRDRATGQVDGHGSDAVDRGDLLGDRPLAVRATHAVDLEGGRADEGVRRAGEHGDSSILDLMVGRSPGTWSVGPQPGASHRGSRRVGAWTSHQWPVRSSPCWPDGTRNARRSPPC